MHMKQAKTSVFGKPTNDFFRSQNYLMIPKNFEISIIKKYDVSAFQNRVDCFSYDLYIMFYKLVKINDIYSFSRVGIFGT